MKGRPGSGFTLHDQTPVLPKADYTFTPMRKSKVNKLQALFKLILLLCLEGQDYGVEVQLLVKTSDPVVGNRIKQFGAGVPLPLNCAVLRGKVNDIRNRI